MTEFSQKQENLRALLEKHSLGAILLQRASSFAWATCGAASYVNTASSFGAASLLVTRDGHHLITNNIEITRLEKEEKLTYQGWEFHVAPWYHKQETIARLTSGLKIGADCEFQNAIDLSTEIALLRTNLTPEEGVRFRVLGRLCSESMDAAIKKLQPGQSEHQIAAILEYEAQSRGVQAIVVLVGTDERIFNYRHPLPTYKNLDRYAMLVLCGRRWGLVCSLSRLVHFGQMPADLLKKAEAVANIDAAFISATRPGRTIGQVLETGIAAYASNEFPEEWRLHHQGGAAGYEPREFVAAPGSTIMIAAGQVFAWNPSIAGSKSEDTIQVGENGNEIITAIPDWPMLAIEIDGKQILRPATLVIE
jgi:antitoxin VapB